MRVACAIILPMLLVSCGYHVAGTVNLLPKTIHSIAIPAFGNATTQYKVSDRLAAALTREFISRTRYDITADADRADAVLTGTVTNFASYPTIFDPATGRATGVMVFLFVQVTLRDRATGKILFTRANMDIRERYEISVDPKVYLDESETAMERLSRSAARSIVSAILEKF